MPSLARVVVTEVGWAEYDPPPAPSCLLTAAAAHISRVDRSAMTSTLGSIAAAQETGLWDLVSFCSAVSGSCWALNTLYSVGEGDIEKTIKHVRERITTPFLDPETVELLTNQPTSQYLLSGAVLKQASKAGDVSM